MAITYDEIETETGKVINSNVKMNRVITDESILEALNTVEEHAYSLLTAE